MRHPLAIFLFRCVLTGLGLAAAAATSPDIHYDTTGTLVIACLLIGVLNTLLRPLLILFTLPFVVLTLGLGLVVINAVVIFLVGHLVENFLVETFWAALWAALLVSLINMALGGWLRPTGGGSPGGRRAFVWRGTYLGPDGRVRTFGNAPGSGGEAGARGVPGPEAPRSLPRDPRRKEREDVIDI